MLPVGASDLQLELLADFVHLLLLQLLELDMHTRPHGSSDVGRTARQVPQLRVFSEFQKLSKKIQSLAPLFVDGLEVCALSQVDDPHVIFLVDPHHKVLVVAYVGTSTCWPVVLDACTFEVLVLSLEDEVLLHHLVVSLLLQVFDREVFAPEFLGQSFESSQHCLLHLFPLSLRH